MLGQSFGGFCATTYLSLAPEGLREVFITGGLPPVGRSVDEVYEALVPRLTSAASSVYFERYPEDRERWARAARWLRAVAQVVGMSSGPEELHYLIEHGAGLARLRRARRRTRRR